jgi:hypothetical protein
MNLKRWVNRNSGSKLDPSAIVLTLRARGIDAPLLRWSRDEVEASRADEIAHEAEERAQEHAEEQRCAVTFRMTWEREDGTAVVGQPFTSGEGQQQLDGSQESQLAQGQRERAELHRFTAEAYKLVVSEMRHIIDTLNEQLQKLRDENEALRTEHLVATESAAKGTRETATAAIMRSLMETHGGEVVAAVKGLLTAPASDGETKPEETQR